MSNIFLYNSLDKEKSRLRSEIGRLQYRLMYQKQKRKDVEDTVKEWKRKYKEQQKQSDKLKEELEKLKEENDKLKKQRDTYRSMLFKENKKPIEEQADIESIISSQPKRKIGAQKGHKGFGRKLPTRINRIHRIFVPLCPDCKGEVTRSKLTVNHTVEDIPAPKEQQTIITKYEVERQWCGNCKKEVTVVPQGVIPNSRLGVNLIGQILIWRYICRMPMGIIVSLLETTYGLVMCFQ